MLAIFVSKASSDSTTGSHTQTVSSEALDYYES